MSLAIFIANRLSLRSPSGKMQSGIVIAVSGIALSVVVMLISIAVMMGFKEEIRQKIMGFDAQLSISVYSPDDSKVPLVDINDVRPVLEMLPEKATTVLAIRQPVILKTPADFTGAIVKGISRDYDWEFIRQNLIEGKSRISRPIRRSTMLSYHGISRGIYQLDLARK